MFKKIIEAANIVAFIVVGAFASTNVSLSLGIKWMAPEATEPTTLQSVIDGIMPKILPFTLTLFTWWLIEKKKISPIKLIIGYLVLGIVGYYLGIIA